MTRLISIVLLLAAAPAFAQEAEYRALWRTRLDTVAGLNRNPANPKRLEEIREAITIARNNSPFLLFVRARSIPILLAPVEDARVDKQVGAPANAPGSASLVSKGAVPSILGFAVENGALTQSTDDAGVTLRGNLIGWVDLLQGKGFIDAYDDDAPLTRQLRRVSYSLTYTNSESSAPETAERPTAEEAAERAKQASRQLAGYSVRVALWDRRDPRRRQNRAAIDAWLEKQGVEVLSSLTFLDPMLNSDAYERWLSVTVTALAAGGTDASALEPILYRRLEEARLLLISMQPDPARVETALAALRAFEGARASVFEAMQQQPLLAFEYVRARPAGLPDISTYRLILEGNVWRRLDLTANAALSVQHEGVVLVPETKTLGGVRDFQLAAQAEWPLGGDDDCDEHSGIGRPVLGFAYLSQKLRDTAVVKFAGHDFNVDPGWIHAAQVRVTIPVKGSGVKVPISLSFANRTELIKEKTVKAHFGITFDLDVLKAGLAR